MVFLAFQGGVFPRPARPRERSKAERENEGTLASECHLGVLETVFNSVLAPNPLDMSSNIPNWDLFELLAPPLAPVRSSPGGPGDGVFHR